MLRFEDSKILLEVYNGLDSPKNYGVKFIVSASKKKDDEEDGDADDDDLNEDENPFDKAPAERNIIENDIPLVDPADDLLNDDDEIPYN